MAKQVSLKHLGDLAIKESPKEVIISTDLKAKLHIAELEDRVIIKLPFGNKFDIIDGEIIIHDKYSKP